MSGFTVRVDDAKARARFSPAAKKKCYSILMPNVRSDSDKYVPYRTGQLDRSLDHSRFDEGIIAWRASYASIVYYMPTHYKWTRTVHTAACPQWMEVSKAANGERWRKFIAESYNGGVT